MATKKPKSSAPSYSNPAFKGFVNVNLTDDDRAAIKRIEFSAGDVLSWLTKCVDSGFKLTFSYDDYSHCFVCVGTRSQRDHVDFGVFMSGRGSTPEKAFRQWLYVKDTLIGDDDWLTWLNPTPRFEIDD